jgi:hypothetical protein
MMVLPNAPPDDRLAVVSDIGTSGEARLKAPAAPAPAASETQYRTFSFPIVLAGTNAQSAAQPQRSEQTGVAASPSVSEAVSGTVVVSAPRAEPEHQSRDLTLAVQTELRRLGCYAGDIDGAWGPASMQGLRAFMDEAGTTLPAGKPDYVTLTLLRGYTGRMCGDECPSGRRSPATGACLSGPTLATRTIRRTIEHGQESGRSRGPAVAAARGDVSSAPTTSNASGWTTTTVETAPVLVRGPSVVSNPRNTPPLEGRMAVGGPTGTLSVVPPAPSPPLSTSSPQTASTGHAADRSSTGQHPSRAASRSNRNWAASRRNTSWTATFFER